MFTSKTTFSGKTGDPVDESKNNTSVLAPSFKLYVEGVQIPFISMSIAQSYGALPRAYIQIPPQSGLMDIIRGYCPKVHIFYEDINTGGYRLLFWGHITTSSYSLDRGAGSTAISFECEHKNALLNQISMDFSGWATQFNETFSDPNLSQAAVKPSSFSSSSMVITAMTGISGVATSEQALSLSNAANASKCPTDKVPESLKENEKRFQGLPGVALNLWNQMKKGAYSNVNDNATLIKMYIPLVEEGLGYFKRMSGHPVLEQRLQDSKAIYCRTKGGQEYKVVVPPYFRTALTSAVSQEMAFRSVNSAVGFSGEMTTFGQITETFLNNCKYDMLTLASPAEVPINVDQYIDNINQVNVQKTTVETIIKPTIPFYFSPICNVLMPKMYSSISLTQNEASVPTRVTALHDAYPGSNSGPEALGTGFKGPSSIREAIAVAATIRNGNVKDMNLGTTKGMSYTMPGRYEQGIGIKPMRVALPYWLALLIREKEEQGQSGNQEAAPSKDSPEYDEMMTMSVDWQRRHGVKITQDDAKFEKTQDSTKDNLNPFDPRNASVLPYERLMYATIDYEHAQLVAGSRNGTIQGIFNPYIIPGYPMDVIADNPNHPSFHGICTSVTHSIGDSYVSTSIGITAAMTYAELSNYYLPPVSPFLSSALNMVSSTKDEALAAKVPLGDPSPYSNIQSGLIQNPNAVQTADSFYKQVLGVGAVAPDSLVHFASGNPYPLDREFGTLEPRVTTNDAPVHVGHPAREEDDYFSPVGNLRLVRREIESKESIESKFGLKFIDLDRDLYNPSMMNYLNPKLAKDLFLEPGASMFLDYTETSDFAKKQ